MYDPEGFVASISQAHEVVLDLNQVCPSDLTSFEMQQSSGWNALLVSRHSANSSKSQDQDRLLDSGGDPSASRAELFAGCMLMHLASGHTGAISRQIKMPDLQLQPAGLMKSTHRLQSGRVKFKLSLTGVQRSERLAADMLMDWFALSNEHH